MDLERLPALVCDWYAAHKRDLPWRQTTDPYLTWVSEIMLQQTRVEAVKPYFSRFIEALPDIAALAACPEDRLLKLWEGLGYYSRVRQMQKAAQQLVAEAKAERYKALPALPQKRDALLALPGIGPYTAGAIASIAFGERVPAVDGNVLRILARLGKDDRDILSPVVKREADAELTRVLQDCPTPGDCNQGLMDLGATVCLAQGEPLCTDCPLATLCLAHAQHCETAYPKRAKAKARRIEKKTILLIRDGERVALQKRPKQGLLAGLYEFPQLEGHSSRKAVLAYVEQQGLEALQIKKLENAKHLFTHVEWQMIGYEIRVAAFPKGKTEKWLLVDTTEVETSYPLPSALRAYAAAVQLPVGAKKGNAEKKGQ